MTYLKGLMIAAAIDLGWIMASPFFAAEPPSPAPVEVIAELPATGTDGEGVDSLLGALARAQDSVMSYLLEHPDDVDAMERVAHTDMAYGSYDAAIGPLARALQLDPSRRSLWSALDRAVRESGRAKITDKELTRRAAEFVEMVRMYGDGC